MTQVIATIHKGGIAVATDSRATRLDDQGNGRTFTIHKLFPCGTHAFALTAGSGIGMLLSQQLQASIQARKIHQAEDIFKLAGPFLSHHYGGILSSGPDRPHEDPLRRLLFLIGGTSPGEIDRPFRMILLASEGGQLQFEEHEVHHCLTIPRILGLEMQLHRMCVQESPLEDILAFAREALIRRAREEEGVKSPFHWGLLSSGGLRMGQWDAEFTDGPQNGSP